MIDTQEVSRTLEARGSTARDLLLTKTRHWPIQWWEKRGLTAARIADELEASAAPSVAPEGTDILFIHGKESGPLGGKYRILAETFGSRVASPSFVGLDLESRLTRAEEFTRGLENAILVGSSMGGLVAAILYSSHPERFASYVLCAAAVNWAPPGSVVRAPERGCLIHGEHDDIIPADASRSFAAQWGLDLVITDDEHRLLGSFPRIVEAVEELLRA